MNHLPGRPGGADKRFLRGAKVAWVMLAGAMLGGCPMPFQYTRAGWAGNASAADPSTPDISGIPYVVYSQSSGSGGTIQTGGAPVTTDSNTTVSLASDTSGAVIYYTTNGTTPDPRSSQTIKYDPSSPIQLSVANPSSTDSSATLTLNATAIGPNLKPSPVMSNVTLTVQYPQAAAPVLTPAGGAYTSDQSLVMTSSTPGATIYYTVASGPGPAPTPVPGQAGTTQYTGPISLTGPANSWTFSAIATASQMLSSAPVSASYSVSYPGLPAPTFNPPAGTYSNDQTVTITSGAGSTIWYTTDGSTPVAGTSPSMSSGGTVTLAGGAPGTGAVAIRALATQSQMVDSPTVTANYLFQVSAPTASPGGGTFNNDLTGASGVAMSTATNGATIYYTTDGTVPSTSSTQYSGALQITTTTTVNAVAARSNYLNSPTIGNTYTMQAATPAFSAGGGTYPNALTVSISEATSGASIYYTTNGTTPTTLSTPYTGPISMPNGLSTTLSAIAVKPGYNNSIVNSATYVVLIPPTGLTLGAATGSSIPVSWNAVPGTALSQYVVIRSTQPTFSSPYYLYPSGTSFTDSGLSPSTQYYYEIQAVYTAGSSAFAGSPNAYTLSSTGDPPVVTVTLPGPYPTPSGWSAAYWTGPSNLSTTSSGPALRYGGYTYIPYSQDTNNDLLTLLVVFDSSYQQVASYSISGVRYDYNMTASGGTVTIYGQGGATASVAWSSIPP
jgi:Chitobiase/beta-hexosaminidase C-terminal domain/Fibronectin type III domain